MKKKLAHAITWMNLENFMLRERKMAHPQNTYGVILLM